MVVATLIVSEKKEIPKILRITSWLSPAQRLPEEGMGSKIKYVESEHSIFLIQFVQRELLFLIGVFTGIYLGTFPNSQKSNTSRMKPMISAREEFIRSNYLDSLDDMPSDSIGRIYITLVPNNN